jgi:phage shock protein PspC (stress-responsive transcriptional regulator)
MVPDPQPLHDGAMIDAEVPSGSSGSPAPSGPADASGPPEPAEPVRLYREPEDKRVAGVCAGMADFIGVDPTVVRLVTVLLVLAKGLGLVAYAVAWLVVPERPAGVPRVRRLGGASSARIEYPAVLILLGVTAVLVLFAPWTWWYGGGASIVGLALLALGIWLLVASRQTREGATTQSGRTATLVGTSADDHLDAAGEPSVAAPPTPASGSVLVGATPGDAPPPAPLGGHPPRSDEIPPPPGGTTGDSDASRVLAVVLIAAGVLALLALTGAVRATTGYVVAAALVTLGILLIVGAWRGRTRWLIWIGLPLIGVLAVIDAVDVPWHAGVGERRVVIDDRAGLSDEHRLLAGDLTIDLTNAPLHAAHVPWSRVATLDAAVGAGELIVILPETTSAEVTARVRAGEINPIASDRHEPESGLGVRREFRLDAGDEESRIRLDLRVTAGEIQIRREPAASPEPTTTTVPPTTAAPPTTVVQETTTTTAAGQP